MDIVERLRRTRATMLGTDDEAHFADCHKAADEIKRLRKYINAVHGKGDIRHEYNGLCPDETQPDSRDDECQACQLLTPNADMRGPSIARLPLDGWVGRLVTTEDKMQYEFICTKHNFKYGFDEPPKGYEAALLDCPVCAKDKKERVMDAMAEVTEHRNMLLNVIDLK